MLCCLWFVYSPHLLSKWEHDPNIHPGLSISLVLGCLRCIAGFSDSIYPKQLKCTIHPKLFPRHSRATTFPPPRGSRQTTKITLVSSLSLRYYRYAHFPPCSLSPTKVQATRISHPRQLGNLLTGVPSSNLRPPPGPPITRVLDGKPNDTTLLQWLPSPG